MFRKEKLKVAKVDLDQDLEIPEFDFDLPPPKDDRKPVKKILDGAISGAKSTLFSKDTLYKTMRKAMPEGFGEALSVAGQVNQSAKKIYSDAVAQIKPSLNDMAKTTSKLVPSEKAKTKAALDSVAKWSESNAAKYSNNTQTAQRESGLDLTLNEVFKFQAEQTIKAASDQNIKDKVQTGLEIARHKDTFGLLNNINLNTSRLSQYQERVTAAYQKKSLEIQYRSYFVAMDALEETKRQNAVTKLSLESIAKNTALPEIVKTTQHETFKNTARNKFWGSINEGLFGGRNDIIGKISENIGTAIRDKISSATNAFSMAAMMGDGLANQREMSESMGMRSPGGLETGASLASGMGIDWLAGKAGDKLRKQLDKNEKVSAASRKIGSLAKNLPQHLNEFKKSNKGDSDNFDDSYKTKALNFLMRAAKNFIPSMQTDDSIESDRAQTLTAPYHFTKQTHKSINEVIPGFLSRIFRELQVLRTGDTKTQLTTYDFTKNKFSSIKEVTNSTITSIVGKNEDGLTNFINTIDKDKRLSPKAKEALAKKIEKDRKDKKDFNIQSYFDEKNNNDPEWNRYSDDIKDVLRKHFKLDKKGVKENSSNFDTIEREKEFKNIYTRSSDKTHTQNQLDGIFKLLDPTGQKLDEKAREVLGKKLLSDNFDTRLGDSKRLSNEDTFKENETKEYAKLFAQTFKEYFSLDKDNELRLNNSYNSLGTYINDPRGFIQNLINLGQYDLLQSTGLINEDASKINLKKLQKLHLGEEVSAKESEELNANNNQIGTKAFEPLIDVTRSGFEKVSYLLEMILDKTSSSTATSDITKKKDFKPVSSEFALTAIRSTPVTKWNYKPGVGDAGSHIGPMAQTVNKTMGEDAAPGGKKIDLVTMNGMTMSAIQELDKRQQEQGSDTKKDIPQKLLDLIKDVGIITNIKLEEIKQALFTTGGLGGYRNDGSIFGSFKNLGKAGIDMSTSLIKGGHKISKGFVNLIPFKKSKELIETAVGGVRNVAEFGLDKLRNLTKIRDVFIAGEIEPRITEAKLRAGKYFLEDENGNRKVLTDISEIKGKIVDETGKVVIAVDELGQMFTKHIKGKGFVRLVTKMGKWVIGKGNQYSKFMLSLIPPALRSVKDALIATKKIAFDLIDEPVDIYVNGNPVAVMIARIMKNGGYISQKTQKVIMHPSEIDGPVLYDGKIVLTLEDIQKGLVDSFGNPIRLPMQKIKDFMSSMLKKTIQFSKKVSSTAIDLTKRGVKAVGTLVTGGLNGLLNGTESFSNKEIKDNSHLLIQIRDLLNNRLPGKRTKFTDNANNIGKTKVDSTGLDKKFNDADGDGNREGSWRTMGKRVKDKSVSIKDSIKDKISEKINGDGKPGIVGKMFNKMMGIKDKDEVAEESLSELTDIKRILLAQAAGGGVSDLMGKGGKAGKAGRFGKLGKLASGAAKLGGKILPGASLALGAAGAYANIKDGNYGQAAVDAGLGLGGYALTGGSMAGLASGAATTGSALLAGAGTIAAGLGALLSSPVVLGTLAVGSVAYFGYKVLTRNKFSKLHYIRLTQYGFKSEDSEHARKVLELEKILLEKNVIFDQGIAKLTDKNFDILSALRLFGIDQTNEEDYNKWISWFTGRFKPVFLTHVTALHGINPKIKLSFIDDLEDQDKIKYIQAVSFPNGPYNLTTSPCPEIKELKATAKDVEKAIAEAKEDLGNIDSKDKSDKTTILGSTKVEGKNLSNQNQTQTPKPTNVDADIKKSGGFLSLIKDTSASANVLTPLIAVGTAVGRFFGYSTSSLETVRFKTYGLKTLDRSKVSALRSLEEIVDKDIKYNSSGNAEWSSNVEILIRYAGKDFGVDSASSDRAKPWITWFTKRFLPVYLAYRGFLKQSTGKENQKSAEQGLKANQEYDIAVKVSATNNVWSVLDSPWEDYKLSSDVKEVAENLALMREKSDKDELVDAKKTINNQNTKSATLGSTPMKQGNQGIKDAIASKGKPVGPTDGETPVSGTGGGTTPKSGSNNAPKAAGGPILNGDYADQYIKLGPGVSLSGLNPDLLKNFRGMAEEYGNKTGKTVYVTSGVRSYIQQQALFKKDPTKAAKPGGSLHEYGLALDISSSTLDELDKTGLMTKYGFTRPVGGEPWHMEPSGIQSNIANAKINSAFASQAINASLGKGGGGYGSEKASNKGKRNTLMAKQIFENGSGIDSSNGDANSTMVANSRSQGQPSRGYVNSVVPDSENSKSEDFKTTVAGSSGAMSKIPDPGPGKGLASVKPTIEAAAKTTGVDPNLMLGMAGIESSFDPSAKSKTSSATGLYQFTRGTWDEMVSKHGEKYGVSPDTPATNAKANALMGGEYLKTNMKIISKTKPDPTNTDLYMAHFLGGNGANKLFSADPNDAAAKVLPKAAKSNKSMFYNGETPRSTSDLYSLVDNKVNKQLSSLGLESEPIKQNVKPPNNIINPSQSNAVSLNDSIVGNESVVTPQPSQRPTPQSSLKEAMTTNVTPVGFSDKTIANQPQQDSRYDMNKAIGSVGDTLKQSLAVQTDMYSVLKDILKVVNPKAIANAMKEAKTGSVPQSSDQVTPDSNSTRSNNTPSGPRNVRPVPVPMSRMQI